MKVKVIATQDELADIYLDDVIEYGEILDVTSEGNYYYVFSSIFLGQLKEGWVIHKKYVEVVE